MKTYSISVELETNPHVFTLIDLGLQEKIEGVCHPTKKLVLELNEDQLRALHNRIPDNTLLKITPERDHPEKTVLLYFRHVYSQFSVVNYRPVKVQIISTREE